MSNRLVEIQLYPLHLPFRSGFKHAAAERKGTDTVVAAALLADGTIGYGEGLPRKYVTGETVESVLYNVGDTLADQLKNLEPKSFPDLLDVAENLPFTNEQNQTINSARCCVELALLDAYGQYFQCGLAGIAGWMGFAGFASSPDSHRRTLRNIRVSGVLDGSEPAKLAKRLRLMRWYGLRDFKLKVGCEYDDENIDLIYHKLERGLDREKITLRVDANGAWDVDTAMNMIEKLIARQVCCLEQPLAPDDRDHMFTLADLSRLPLMADESLISFENAEFLAENDLIDDFNIRISKNGGLIPALHLAELAAKYDRDITLGAMVGESAILAAAGHQFLQMVPNVKFTEICYSTFLLQEDLSIDNMRFGYGGKLAILRRTGLGIRVDREKITKFLSQPPRKIPLA
jgi:L-Ala-D/L-Glu epimerase / N-acetyl-D-glutamate racemase